MPTFKQVSSIVSGTPNGYMGWWEHSFAINGPGTLMAVGCANCAGGGQVFTYYNDGESWIDIHTITYNTGGLNANCGFSVSLGDLNTGNIGSTTYSGTHIAIGCPGSNQVHIHELYSATGAYPMSNAFWGLKRTIVPSSPSYPNPSEAVASTSGFGSDVSMCDTGHIVVGAYASESYRGAAFFYRRQSATHWQHVWTRKHTTQYAQMGNSVSLSPSCEYAAVASWGVNEVDLYRLSSSDVWSYAATYNFISAAQLSNMLTALKSPNPGAVQSVARQGDLFGCDVSCTDGGTVVIGARRESHSGGVQRGNAFVHRFGSNTHIWEMKDDISNELSCGYTVQISADAGTVYVSCSEGIYAYERSSSGTYQPSMPIVGGTLTPAIEAVFPNTNFGRVFAASYNFNRIIVGAWNIDKTGMPSTHGSTWYYERCEATRTCANVAVEPEAAYNVRSYWNLFKSDMYSKDRPLFNALDYWHMAPGTTRVTCADMHSTVLTNNGKFKPRYAWCMWYITELRMPSNYHATNFMCELYECLACAKDTATGFIYRDVASYARDFGYNDCQPPYVVSTLEQAQKESRRDPSVPFPTFAGLWPEFIFTGTSQTAVPSVYSFRLYVADGDYSFGMHEFEGVYIAGLGANGAAGAIIPGCESFASQPRACFPPPPSPPPPPLSPPPPSPPPTFISSNPFGFIIGWQPFVTGNGYAFVPWYLSGLGSGRRLTASEDVLATFATELQRRIMDDTQLSVSVTVVPKRDLSERSPEDSLQLVSVTATLPEYNNASYLDAVQDARNVLYALAAFGINDTHGVVPQSLSESFPQITAPPSASGLVMQDPHITFPNGARTDWRSVPGRPFCFLTAPRAHLNVVARESIFSLKRKEWVTINGTFLDQAHAVMNDGVRTMRVSYDANRIGTFNLGLHAVNASCNKGPSQHLWPHTTLSCSSTLRVERDYSSIRLHTDDWVVVVRSNPIYDRIAGPFHRLDIEVRNTTAVTNVHGILGQGFDPRRTVRDGAVDVIPDSGNFTTRAMAQGSIEGDASEYEVSSAYATTFRYSQYVSPAADSRL